MTNDLAWLLGSLTFERDYQQERSDVSQSKANTQYFLGRAEGASYALHLLSKADIDDSPSSPVTYAKLADNFAEAVTGTVDGPRAEAYGHPEDMCKLIASYWNVYLEPVDRIEAHHVAVMLTLMKIARGQGHMTADTALDMAGYAYILAKVKAASEASDEATT